MATNTLTDLAGDIYLAADKVGHELTGFIAAVTRNTGADRAAKGDTIRSHFAPESTVGDNTAAMTIPEGTNQTIANKTMTMGRSRGVPIPYTGEEVKHLDNGSGFKSVYGDQFLQAMRAIANEVETDLAVAATAGCSHGYGTAGTTPFGTANDYTGASNVLKLLKDNGAGAFDNSLVIDTSAGANFIGKQSAVNAAGTESMLRQGVLLDLAGMPIRESAQIQSHTAGTAASATTDDTGYAVGETSIALASAGTGTILTGDLITFAGDTTQYYVVTGDSAVNGGGTIVLQEPGLKVAITTAATAITMVATSTRNIGFSRSAIELAMRAPAMPEGGDAASDSMQIIDPRSGLSFDVSVYKGFQKTMINISAVWGVKVWRPEHVVALIG